MKTFPLPTREQVSPESQLLFDTIKKRMGKVPNLYAAMGHSPFALQMFMNMEDSLSKGAFNAKEREAVALIVSQINSCEYCLAGHTAAAIKRGFTKEQTIGIRKGEAADPRLSAIIRLSKEIAENKGKPSDDSLTTFYNAGFNEAAVMELIGLVVLRIFTNYTFALTNVPIDFPAAERLS